MANVPSIVLTRLLQGPESFRAPSYRVAILMTSVGLFISTLILRLLIAWLSNFVLRVEIRMNDYLVYLPRGVGNRLVCSSRKLPLKVLVSALGVRNVRWQIRLVDILRSYVVLPLGANVNRCIIPLVFTL